MSTTTTTTVFTETPQQAQASEIELFPLASRSSIVAGRASSSEQDSPADTSEPAQLAAVISKWSTAVIICTVSSVTLLNSLLGGLLVVGLPTMAKDLDLDANLLLWPASVNA
jgi:hypothetical protein